jgi:hypothetical protein
MENSTLPIWITKIEREAENLDIVLNFTILELGLNHSNPWSVLETLRVTLYVTDEKDTASWTRNLTVYAYIPIEELEDPVYAINTMGRITNQVFRSNESDFTDYDNLKERILASTYTASNMSPSFLMRLEGNLSPSPMGIESIINLNEFIIQGLPILDKSMVDYIYFASGTVPNCLINETYSDDDLYWFRLDEWHRINYSLTCAS